MKNAGYCYKCKCEVWIPDALYEAAQRGRGSVEFFCGYGHTQVFVRGESQETKLRRECDRLTQKCNLLTQKLAAKDDEICQQRDMREFTERRLAATRGALTRLKNRVSKN